MKDKDKEKELETREKLHELLRDALLNEDEDQVYTMTIERLKALGEKKGIDEDLAEFARLAAIDFEDEPSSEDSSEKRKLIFPLRRRKR